MKAGSNSFPDKEVSVDQEYFQSVRDIEKFSEVPEVERSPFVPSLVNSMELKRVVKHAENSMGMVDIIDKGSGEVVSSAEENRVFTKREYVDNDKFTKVYADRLKILFGLSKTAINAFFYILDLLQKPHNINRDLIFIDITLAQEWCGFKTNNSVYRGLTELVRVGFIAKSSVKHHFYIDPRTVFNGNRIMVMEEYIKKDNDYFDDKSLSE